MVKMPQMVVTVKDSELIFTVEEESSTKIHEAMLGAMALF